MKIVRTKAVFLICMAAVFPSGSQTRFDLQSYRRYVETHRDMSTDALLSEFPIQQPYYRMGPADTSLAGIAYLDSIRLKFPLTREELALLGRNRFVVTERLNHDCFGCGFHDVYRNDLPVMITADAVLQALHASYDRILSDVEIGVLQPRLDSLLAALYGMLPRLAEKYRDDAPLAEALADADLYVTVAKSLLNGAKLETRFCPAARMDDIWNAVQAEQYVEMPLFSKRARKLDFSQFRVRGHYTREFWDPATQTLKTLGPYFKAMMWLGRIDFLLTPPPAADELPWTREEIRRMNLGAVILNELIDSSGVRSVLESIDGILRLMVGESDNLTPAELAAIVAGQRLTDAAGLLDDGVFDSYHSALIASQLGGQRILSDCFVMNPFSAEPDTLPVSFRLMGQRFIVDSYIFSNLVYDRIVYQGEKIWRPMPDPLDALFVLGNDNAAPLLKAELDQYHYASQAASLRYLVDSFDPGFWDASLYNSWLNAVRLLNPPQNLATFPLFMRTAAWQHEKLNTQLASWAQLRHDNLLYAKQSYTGMTTCSFPHSYVEPYPEFFRQIARFARQAKSVFEGVPAVASWRGLGGYFTRLDSLSEKLGEMALKELDRIPFSQEETDFLKRMLFIDGMSGSPPYSGWYSELFYEPWDAAETDYIVADVHTQPTDAFGALVGRVLHVGVGRINLGVFLADSPSSDFRPMAYMGPVMSYYQTVTENFDRLTDERWAANFSQARPTALGRPDWVSVYLADAEGKSYPPGRELYSVIYNGTDDRGAALPERLVLEQNYPNPFNPSTRIAFRLPASGRVRICILDRLGRMVDVPVDAVMPAGRHVLQWESGGLASGLYVCRIQADSRVVSIKMVLVR